MVLMYPISVECLHVGYDSILSRAFAPAAVATGILLKGFLCSFLGERRDAKT